MTAPPALNGVLNADPHYTGNGTLPAGDNPADAHPVAELSAAARNESPVLEAVHLHRHFGRLRAVDDVSFRAYPGQVMGFIGPNGAGKTTTMRVFATLDMPTAGDAFVGGYSVIDDPDAVRRLLGFMPDNFGKYANMSVTEYLDFYARAYGLRGASRRDALERVLVFTELRKIAQKPITTLSKGMSQRLGLGRTLIHDPQVLILDEPAAGLDPRARIELRELIRLLAIELRKTVLISSHILTELGAICDSAAIIEAGRILAAGTIDELQRTPSRAERRAATEITVRLLDGTAAATEPLRRWLLEQPRILSATGDAGTVTVAFEGTDAHRRDLLREMIAANFPVVDFGSKTITLEDAFMDITRGIVQ